MLSQYEIDLLQELHQEGRVMTMNEYYVEYSTIWDNNGWFIFDKTSKPYDYDYSIGYWLEYQEGRYL